MSTPITTTTVAVRANQTYGIYKRVNGVDTLLYESNFYNTRPPTFRATLRVVGNQISVEFSFQQGATVTDNSLTHGRGGVATWLARADFDDVHVAGTDVYLLFEREYGFGGSDYVSGLDELSGDWEVLEVSDGEESYLDGLAQRDTSGDARAVIGTPVANQELIARMRVDAYSASQQGAWFGLLAQIRRREQLLLRDHSQHGADSDPQEGEWGHHRAGLCELHARARAVLSTCGSWSSMTSCSCMWTMCSWRPRTIARSRGASTGWPRIGRRRIGSRLRCCSRKWELLMRSAEFQRLPR